MAASLKSAAAVAIVALLSGCQRRETPEETRARTSEAFLVEQVASLEKLVVKAEAGDVATADRIAIGISEATVKALLDVSLPREQLVAGRLRVRVESAQPLFRGNNAGMLFQASAQGTTLGTSARLELGGRLSNFRIEKGTLTASVELAHIKVLDSSFGDIGSDVLERLVQDNLGLISGQLPPLVIPVHLEESIKIPGFNEGPVSVKSGVLPLAMTLAEVIPVSERLWVLLEVKAGPWQRGAAAEKGP